MSPHILKTAETHAGDPIPFKRLIKARDLDAIEIKGIFITLVKMQIL